jgi:isoquinoline 1-oxidoreductase alpha subunit
MQTLSVNGKAVTVDVPGGTPILWTLRDELGLTGTKFGCERIRAAIKAAPQEA